MRAPSVAPLAPCRACGVHFRPTPRAMKFCSRACYLSQCVRSETRTCRTCECEFVAKHNPKRTAAGATDTLNNWCSKACADTARKQGADYVCVQCEKPFYASPSRLAELGESGCCSRACQSAYFTGPRNKHWRGGKYTTSADGVVHVRLETGRGAKHIREHRMIVARAIGRTLKTSEVVLHINNDHSDNKPSNLYLCASRSVSGRILTGTLPWPTSSNLSEFIVTGTAHRGHAGAAAQPIQEA